MESIYLPTLPNIFWLKVQLLSEVFFVLVVFLVLVFFLWYFIVKYRSRKKLYKQLHHLQSQASHLSRQMLAQKIEQSAWKELLVLFVEYLERFAANKSYSGVPQLLGQHGFDQQEITCMIRILYQGGHLDEGIQKKILALKID